MSAHPSETGKPYRLVKTSHDELVEYAEYLDTLEPEQFAQYEGQCDLCGTPFYGILDEAKLLYPIGYLAKRLRHKTSRKEVINTGFIFDLGFSAYEGRQLIVKSGLFHRNQLKRSFFSEHELEVNDRSFYHVRPKRCDCFFGSPDLNDTELGILAEFSDPVPTLPLTGVDLDFVSGRPVRTGFRLRSKEAIRRRRKKRSQKDRTVLDFFQSLIVETIPVPTKVALGSELSVVNPQKIKLIFKDDSCMLKHTKGPKKDQARIRKCEYYHRKVIFPFQLPVGPYNTKRYCYFFRRNGYFKVSQHHHDGGHMRHTLPRTGSKPQPFLHR